LARYRSIGADAVAQAVANMCFAESPGRFVHEYRDIVRWSRTQDAAH
jgi:hypothetical protein